VLHGGPNPRREETISRAKRATHCKAYGRSVVSCAKTADPIEMPYGMLSRVDPRNDVLDEGADAETGRGTFRGVTGPLQRLGKRVSSAKTGGPILTIYSSYDVLLHKEVPFGVVM